MRPIQIIDQLAHNRSVFKALFDGVSPEQYNWKPAPDKWCMLEVACHLYDEEREDFRARVRYVLETPELPAPGIDPVGWVTQREYMKQDYTQRVEEFLEERANSVEWLRSLNDPKWDNAYQHPEWGPLTAKMFLANWLAHDYLHFRQLTRLKYQYLKAHTNEPLNYAGEW